MVSGLTCTLGEVHLVHGISSMEGVVEICNYKSSIIRFVYLKLINNNN